MASSTLESRATTNGAPLASRWLAAACAAVLCGSPGCTDRHPPGTRVVAETSVSQSSASPRGPDDGALGPVGSASAPTRPSAGLATHPSPTEPGAGAQPNSAAANDATLHSILELLQRRSAGVLSDPPGHRVQLLIAEVDEGAGAPRLIEHSYRVDAEYLYPASTIKPLMAAAALRYLEQLSASSSRPLTIDTPLRFGVGASRRCTVALDASNLDGRAITIGHLVRRMLLVSDNAAFGRLYDLVDHQVLHDTMADWGLTSVRLRHRMGGSEADGLRSPAVELLTTADSPLRLEPRESSVTLEATAAHDLLVGRAHRDETGVLRAQPRDFGDRNYASLRDLQRLLTALVRPELVPSVRLDLSERHRQLLVEIMGTAPNDSRNPRYAGPNYAESRFRPLLAGILRVVPRAELDYVSKSGRAYGFMTENAYLHNQRTGRSVFVAAGLYVDDDGVVNDDQYGYVELGAPLLEDLGEAVARQLLLDSPSP